MAFAAPSTLSSLFGAPVATPNKISAAHPLGKARVARPRTRVSRSHIVALGPSPASPTPPEKESSEPTDETVPPVDPVNGAAAEAQASAGADAKSETSPDSAAPEPVPSADDILSSPSFLKKKLEIVEKELLEARESVTKGEEALKSEKADYLRLVADFDNFRRRNSEEIKKLETKSTAKVCKAVLGVLDNFDRALDSFTPETDRESSLQKSYGAINKQLTEALGKLGVESVDPLGDQFDPGFHEAIQKLESEDYHDGVVCAVYQKGYKIGESLVRAAVVAVSTGPGPAVILGEDKEVTDVPAVDGEEEKSEESGAEESSSAEEKGSEQAK